MSKFSRTSLLLWLAVVWWLWCVCFAMAAVREEKYYNSLMEQYHKAVHMQEDNCYNLLVNHKL